MTKSDMLKENEMKIRSALAIVLMVGLLMASFGAGTVFASTGCFSDAVGHWAETFICFLKDNGITSGFPDGTYKPENGVTRAEMAVFLQRSIEFANATSKTYADSLVNTPPATGDILISGGFSSWRPLDTTYPVTSFYSSNVVGFTSSVANTYVHSNQPDLPVALYGKSLEFVGVEICYTASPGNNLLNEIRVRTYNQVSAPGGSSVVYTDATDRADSACRYYVLPAPVLMTSEMGAQVFADISWSVAGTQFGFGRTTYVFRATGTSSTALSKGMDENTVILQEVTGPDTSPEAAP
jgi:hypothetical protein